MAGETWLHLNQTHCGVGLDLAPTQDKIWGFKKILNSNIKEVEIKKRSWELDDLQTLYKLLDF